MKKRVVRKPWGREEIIALNEPVTVKIITVKPKQLLSLQTHKLRAEYWQVLNGNPKITVGNKTVKAQPGQEFFINKHQKHRIESTTQTSRVLEVAFGKWIAEDIIRLEDKYGRAK